MEGTITADDPRAADVRALLETHLELMNELSPPEEVHALDVDALGHPSVTFVGYRHAGELLGVGALKDLGDGHGELKSMHTTAAARGRGVGTAIVDHLVGVAAERGMTRLSLETGTPDGFAAARSLYARRGFAECGPFGDYVLSPWSTFMTRSLA
ncbi:GNAT family N-acetyltransferase [Nocardioides sp. SR21]|uniref:GNAT family N-acetyltransferase n=1 Tax=Nocardioides sp. SR21 TaxID=2919501 RepID=UPI001FAA180D|nr:GNAT family N-acetyltransferase [Nocardioides sp. SR21]